VAGNISSYFNFHNLIGIKFITNNPSFHRFVVENFHFYVSTDMLAKYEMLVTVNFSKEKKMFHRSFKKISSNVFIDEKRILYLDDRCALTILFEHPTSNHVRITASVTRVPKKGVIPKFLDFYYKISRINKSRLYESYMIIMREVLHLPLLYILQKEGYILLHGSAVEKYGKAYLFVGGNAMGKTTLALYLVSKFGFKFLSDDFLLIKNNKILSFVEKQRTLEDVYKKIVAPYLRTSFKAQTKIYNKYHFLLPSAKLSKVAVISKIFFLEFSNEVTLKKINSKKAIKRLRAIHNYLHEFPEYSYIAFTPDFPFLTETALKNMLKGKQLYLFYMSRNLDRNVKTLLNEIK